MKPLFPSYSVTLAALLFSYPAAAIPISGADIVSVDGTDWAQVVLFKNLSWDDINAVCPGGNCVSGSTLNGWDMEGWVWASVSEVADLFNTYLPSGCQVTAPPERSDYWGYSDYSCYGDDISPEWNPTEFMSDWRYTERNGGFNFRYPWATVRGWSSNPGILPVVHNGGPQLLGFWDSYVGFHTPDEAEDTQNMGPAQPPGAWFYRAVPAPATLWLFGSALCSLGFVRLSRARSG